jgi:hypothetical protein
MFGIGWSELIILLVIGLLTVVPGIAGLGVLIWLIVRKKPTPGSNTPSDEPGNN